jgi:hypothetical protein
LSREFDPKRWNGFGEPATGARPSEPPSTTIGWHGPPVGTGELSRARVPGAPSSSGYCR